MPVFFAPPKPSAGEIDQSFIGGARRCYRHIGNTSRIDTIRITKALTVDLPCWEGPDVFVSLRFVSLWFVSKCWLLVTKGEVKYSLQEVLGEKTVGDKAVDENEKKSVGGAEEGVESAPHTAADEVSTTGRNSSETLLPKEEGV